MSQSDESQNRQPVSSVTGLQPSPPSELEVHEWIWLARVNSPSPSFNSACIVVVPTRLPLVPQPGHWVCFVVFIAMRSLSMLSHHVLTAIIEVVPKCKVKSVWIFFWERRNPDERKGVENGDE